MRIISWMKRSAAIAAATLFLSAHAETVMTDSERLEYKEAMETAANMMLKKQYAEAASAATAALSLVKNTGTPLWINAEKMSVSANAALRNSGVEPGNRSLVIYRAVGKMHLMHNNTVARVYEIGVGPDFTVPGGAFTVGEKLGYPKLELDGKPFGVTDRENFLGSRWLELVDREGVVVSGIHGTKHPAELKSIRTEDLFFRLKNTDVNEIFPLLKKGTSVIVK